MGLGRLCRGQTRCLHNQISPICLQLRPLERCEQLALRIIMHVHRKVPKAGSETYVFVMIYGKRSLCSNPATSAAAFQWTSWDVRCRQATGALYRTGGARRIVKGEIRSGPGGRSVGSKPTERKVRAPQDTVVGNAHRPQGPGKCNRKQTAPGVRPRW